MARADYLSADMLAVQLYEQGFSLDVIDRAVERAALLEHEGRLGPLAALIAGAVEGVDGTPADRRYQRQPSPEGTTCEPPTPARTAVAC